MENSDQRLNIARVAIDGWQAKQPDELALLLYHTGREELRTISNGQLRQMVLTIASHLIRSGARPGERLLIRLKDGLDYILAILGGFAAGMVVIPCSPQLTGEEAGFLAQDSGAQFAIGNDLALDDFNGPRFELASLLEPLNDGILDFADTQAEEPALLIYTSGSTGKPKGVLHGHKMILGRKPMRDGWTGIQKGDIVLHAGQMNWTYSLGVGLLDPLAWGAVAVIVEGSREAKFWPILIEKLGVTIFAAVPGIYRQILKLPDLRPQAFKSLRHGLTAGEPLDPGLLSHWQETVGTDLYEALGMSEISTYISTGPQVPIKPGSPGKAQAGRKVVIVDEKGGEEPLPPGQMGLIAIDRSDPGLMISYWNREAELTPLIRGKWFVGGDRAHRDEDGYFWFDGRNDDIIKASGYRISPLEIENVLLSHPAILEAAVNAFEVKPSVHILAAWLILKPDQQVSDDQILSHCRQHLAGYKIPRQLTFLNQLPRTANGKVKRGDLPKSPMADNMAEN